MDYIFDALVEPIEVEIDNKINIRNKFPDSFRRTLFNKNKKIKYVNDPIKMAKLTGTKNKYWSNNYDIMASIIKYFKKISDLPAHKFIDIIDNNHENLCDLKKYYNKIYDMADIAVVKYSVDYSSLTHIIKNLLEFDNNPFNKPPHIRIIIYLYAHMCKIWISFYSRNFDTGTHSLITKINEIQSEPDDIIIKYFTKSELSNYIEYTNKLKLQKKSHQNNNISII